MNNTNNQQRCSSLDEIFGTAKAVTSSIDGLVDVANMAYQTGCNVINNAAQFQQGYPQSQQSQFFYDNNSRRNQFPSNNMMYPNGYPTTPNPVPNYGYGYGNITNNSFGMFNNMNGLNNIGYPGIANPGYGMLATY